MAPANNAEGRDKTVARQPSAEEVRVESELSLVDRVIGLEQQLNEVSGRVLLTPSEQVAVERRLHSMTTSPEWRIGRLVAFPLRVARYAKRRIFR